MSPLTLPLPRNVMALSLTPSPGMHVSEAVEVICLIARTTNITTSVVFNGFLLTADPTTTEQELLAQFHKERG